MVKIRPAVRSDAAAIVSVRQEAIFSKASAHYAPGILDAWAASAMPDREARVELQIADPGFVVLVAETGEEIIGYAIATPARSELRAVYVKPNPSSSAPPANARKPSSKPSPASHPGRSGAPSPIRTVPKAAAAPSPKSWPPASNPPP